MTMLPFRVSTDFNLGQFLKNEKSVLRMGERGTVGGGKLGFGFGPSFVQVDAYVTHEYWTLDIELLISIFVPILWSATSLYLLTVLLPSPCTSINRPMTEAAIALAVLNIVASLLTTGGLIFAKYSTEWRVKTDLLSGTIALCLLLATANFLHAFVAFSSDSCGASYAEQLHMYDGSGEGEERAIDNQHIDKHLETRNKNGSTGETTAESIINNFRYYDTKIAGLTQVLASVGQVTSAMILLVKRNDIKMYTLWRLGKLDSYIEDMHSHN